MEWTVETLNETVDRELGALPADMRARFSRICGLISAVGLERMGAPHVRHLESAAAELGSVRTRYLVGFLCRLAMLMPTVSLRLAWRVGARQWFVPGPTGRSR